jgi:3-oxoacyl-[acyl-carrier protein] reductase
MNIIISGGSKGLGKDLVSKFLNRGSNVINLSRTRNNTINSNLFNYKVDLIFEKNTLKTVKKIKKRHGKIDLIICCVGSGKSVPAGKKNKKSWDQSLSTNFFSATNLIESYLSVYKNKKTKIILISSIAGLKIIDAPITYSVAKAALNYYGKMKSKHLAKYNINLNIISPGNILQRKNVWDKKMKKDNLSIKRYIKKNVPLNTFCNTKQIYDLCAYLLSRSGDSITGSNFVIDGGQSL